MFFFFFNFTRVRRILSFPAFSASGTRIKCSHAFVGRARLQLVIVCFIATAADALQSTLFDDGLADFSGQFFNFFLH